jgi:hypothetical protein
MTNNLKVMSILIQLKKLIVGFIFAFVFVENRLRWSSPSFGRALVAPMRTEANSSRICNQSKRKPKSTVIMEVEEDMVDMDMEAGAMEEAEVTAEAEVTGEAEVTAEAVNIY